jgi:hypothetical protein
MSPVLIRDLREDELDFLRDMLYAALAWRPGVELPRPELGVEAPVSAPRSSRRSMLARASRACAGSR